MYVSYTLLTKNNKVFSSKAYFSYGILIYFVGVIWFETITSVMPTPFFSLKLQEGLAVLEKKTFF